MMTTLSQLRQLYQPKIPKALKKLSCLKAIKNNGLVHFDEGKGNSAVLRVGVVLSGGQAAGGHNVITGLFDALKQLNSQSSLIGFLGGPKGILENSAIPLTQELLASYRNQGGFDLIGSGRTKIETEEQFQAALKTVQSLDLDGLVIIGGDDSNTNASFLADFFSEHQCKTVVVGVPKTIDGDLKNSFIEISFGFDTAAKVYSELIGNIARDALSAKKYYHVIKLMGRSASHIALECALQTHPNYTFISEEVAAKKLTLKDLVKEVSDLISARATLGKDYGVILIPEGLIEFIPEMKQLIQELNLLIAKEIQDVVSLLSKESQACFLMLPEKIQQQLLMDRDPHGNVQVSKIETDQLFIELASKELKERKATGGYIGEFNPQAQFCGYEGRCAYPTNFDSNYCYTLGYIAALLISEKVSGYMAAVMHLTQPVESWKPVGVPLKMMMTEEMRHGSLKSVIKKGLVELEGNPFKQFSLQRDTWKFDDDYQYPGPIQFFGPEALTDTITETLRLEHLVAQ